MHTIVLLFLLAPLSALAQLKIVSTVIEPKTGKVEQNLKASDFVVVDSGSQVPVQNLEVREDLIDYLLLVDNSLIGGSVRSLASELIQQLKGKEQMSVVAFSSSANLVQDFTVNRELLLRSVSSLKTEDSPRVFDALYAALEGGFRGSSFRRVILLLTAGVEGPSRTSEREVIQLARQSKVSIYPIYAAGYGRGLLEQLAQQTGGASFYLKDLSKNVTAVAPAVMDTVRHSYLLTLRGNLPLSEKAKISIQGKPKLQVSMLQLE